jgi:peptidoglycan/LPS O-acetylase OafA/YrhL
MVDSEQNSLNAVRLLAALAVLFSHSFEIALGPNSAEPIGVLTHYTLGQHAVNAFFVISGLTLAHSIARNSDLRRFLVARCLRIFPGLIACGFFFAFILGPLLTSRSFTEYFTDSHTYLYPLSVAVAFDDAMPPIGIFESVPLAGAVNTPLWTLRYELAAYVGLAMFAATGLFLRVRAVFLTTAVVLVGFIYWEAFHELIAWPEWVGSLDRFGFCFLLGVAAYAVRDKIVLSPIPIIAAIPVLWLLNDTILAHPAYCIFIAYLVLLLGWALPGALARFARRTDISYGTYIYGWPIQQALVALVPGIALSVHLVLSLLLAPIAGLLSWQLVERHAIGLNRSLSRPDTAHQQLQA